MFPTYLRRYAELLLKQGINLHSDQALLISGEAEHSELAEAIAEVARELKAGSVTIVLQDPLRAAEWISKDDCFEARVQYRRLLNSIDPIVRVGGAHISLRGMSHPVLFQSLSEEHPEAFAAYMEGYDEARQVFRRFGINAGRCPWLVASAPTHGWAKQVFPNLGVEDALTALWDDVFEITGVKDDAFLEHAKQVDEQLHERAQFLNGLKIEGLHIFGGGSDFHIKLSDQARWGGGSKETIHGQSFQANIPSFEAFTTPDARTANGKLVMSRPFLAQDVLVEDLSLEFESGRVVHFDASSGVEMFERLLALDEGASRIGEVALVGLDSPIAQRKRMYCHTLLDENARCHIALGSAYISQIAQGRQLNTDQLTAIGVNRSLHHTDMMFSSDKTGVVAHTFDGRYVPIIRNGNWVQEE